MHIFFMRRIYCSTTFGRERINGDENDSMACPRVFGSALAKAVWQTQKEKRINKKMQARACIFFCTTNFLPLWRGGFFM